MPLTVEQARKKRVCRLCEQPVGSVGMADAPFDFQRQIVPIRVTYDFGKEFAHTKCLEQMDPVNPIKAPP